MPLVISDEVLTRLGLSEQEARVEFACIFFDLNRLSLKEACDFCGLDRVSMEIALGDRGIPIIRYTPEDLARELAQLDQLSLSR